MRFGKLALCIILGLIFVLIGVLSVAAYYPYYHYRARPYYPYHRYYYYTPHIYYGPVYALGWYVPVYYYYRHHPYRYYYNYRPYYRPCYWWGCW